MTKREVKFWGLFFLLNTLFFLPKFLLNIDSSTFFPDFYNAGTPRQMWKFFFRRENQDIFRISVDLLILLWGTLLLKYKKPPRFFGCAIFAIYIVLFFYQIYQGSIQALYQQNPLFYSDAFLIKEGFSILLVESSVWLLLLALISVVLVSYLIYRLVIAFIKTARQTSFSLSSKLMSLLISIFCVMSLIDFRTRLDNLELAFPLQGYWIVDNIRRSIIVYQSTHQLDPTAYSQHYNYENDTLNTKPNVYLFFIESYGKVLYEDPALRNSYLANLKLSEEKLKKYGWGSTSAFSQSPVKGGRSWLSFTSFVTGTRIDKHALYEYLVDNPEFNLPTLYKSLKSFGYKSYWLSALQNNGRDIPYKQYARFYGIDQWIKFDDLNYQGKLYGVLPAPADQYSLNFAHDFIYQQAAEPYVLFFISLNSHSPFDSPDTVVDDWRSLGKPDSSFGSKKNTNNSKLQNYLQSINYQLDYLTTFIIQNGRENDLFILIGDHQPPVLANRSESFDTPVHIISQNAGLIENFATYKFGKGLVIKKSQQNSLQHAGFYSLIMRELLHAYGTKCKEELNYFPDGVQLGGQ